MTGASTGMANEKKVPEKRTYTVDEIAGILGIGKSSAYKLAKSGKFKIIRIGSSIRIIKQSFEDWLSSAEETE